MSRAPDPVYSECDYLSIDVSTNSTTVVTGPCVYYGAVVTTALSAHVVLVKDDTNIIDAFAASATIGTGHFLPVGVRCATSLVLDPDDSSTGNVTIYYKPISS